MQIAAVLNPPVVIRQMSRDDIAAASELSEEQLWPHRPEDWSFFLDTGEGLVAEYEGRVVGTTMGWRFGDDMASIGMVIVSPAMQGRGIGRKLMEAMIARLGDRTVVLNATDEGLPLYRKLGFVETGVIQQHQGQVNDVPLPSLRSGERVRPTGRADGALPALYGAASGMDRSELFRFLSKQSRTVVHTRNHHPAGFAMLRRFGRGWSVGPVVGSDTDSARALILHWLAVKRGSFCRLDVTGDSGLGPWLEMLGLPCVGTVRSMVRGTPPAKGAEATVFAIAAQALG